MADRSTSIAREWRLLLACARVRLNSDARDAVRQIPFDDINWTLFARLAIEHGLAALVGQTLNSVAPERAPIDILDAFRAIGDATRTTNSALLSDLAEVLQELADVGIEAAPIRGPVLAMQAYGDICLRQSRGLHLLVRDSDTGTTISTLRRLGYERKSHLSAAQLDVTRRLEGRETLFKKSRRITLAIHSRLSPITMPLDVDYAALWRRTQRTSLYRRTVLMPEPEDALLMLAIHGGERLWRRIRWTCDVAAFIGSHPDLDWGAVIERARAQGCPRMVLLATALSRRYFGAATPDTITAAERADHAIEPLAQRVMAHWLAAEAAALPRGTEFSIGPFRLLDGVGKRLSYLARTFLPEAHHIARVPLPEAITSLPAYVPIKLGQDLALLPLLKVYRDLRKRSELVAGLIANAPFALELMPISAESKRRMRLYHAARSEAARALAANPNNATAWHRLGAALAGLKRYEEAIACYDKALAIVPDSGAIWNDRAAAARAGNVKPDIPAVECERGDDLHDANAWARRAGFLAAAQRLGEAAAASDRALAINPNHLAAMRIGIRSRIGACDWTRREDDKRRISDALKAGAPIITPFNHRAISESEAEHLVVAQLFAKEFPKPKPLWRSELYRHERIRVAYLSANFHQHPTATLIAGVFEHHDKARFETIAFSFGPDDRSAVRKRIEAEISRFVDARAMTDAEIAAKLREMEVSIAVDLNGHAGAGRSGILAFRPCPVQVNFLGNAGTMGTPFLDYIVADRTVIPRDHFCNYTEKVIHLPHSYQCNDSRRPLPQQAPSRIEAGLPEKGFVFCCFNNSYKIAPAIFEAWIRLLNACPGSVLWLLEDNPYAVHNLRREAAARGVAPQRLIFAPRLPEDNHLARHALADLFLDTLPVNAHATASDALWAGLPLLTCKGETFAGRVAASLLLAAGLPELVASSLAEYEQIALALARDKQRLAAIRSKVIRNRDTAPLFDTAAYTRDLEAAYAMMFARNQRGEPPENFSVSSAIHPAAVLDA